jgi:hypothetical protein
MNPGQAFVVQDGYVVSDVEASIDAAGKLDRLDRAAIRARFEQRFTADRMANDYVAAYRSLVNAFELPLARPAGLLAEGRSAESYRHGGGPRLLGLIERKTAS